MNYSATTRRYVCKLSMHLDDVKNFENSADIFKELDNLLKN